MKLLRRYLFFLALLCCATQGFAQLGVDTSAVNFSQPRELEVGGIRVEGIVSLDANSLIARSGLLVGSTITIPGDEISKAIQNLWKLRLFSNVAIQAERVTGNTVFLVIQLDELPRISKYSPGGMTKAE